MADQDDDVELLEQMLLSAEAAEAEESSKQSTEESLVRPRKNFYTEDSSDEDEKKELYSKYNDYGRDINKKLKEAEELKKFNSIKLTNEGSAPKNEASTSFSSLPSTSSASQKPQVKIPAMFANVKPKETVFCDPIFGLRYVNPVISSATLKERMIGKIPVGVQRVRFHTERGDQSQDWVSLY